MTRSALARRPTAPPALVSTSLARLEAEIGGRDALVAALAHAPKSKDVDYLLGLLGDPLRAKTPIADLCAAGGITAGELLDAYKAGELNRAQALATQKVGEKLRDVAADTMRRSLPERIACPDCRGTGQWTPEPTKKQPHPKPGPCETCGAIGTVVREGDLEHKKLALEMGHLLVKGGGMSISVHQQVGIAVGAVGGALEKLQAATDQILYGDGVADPPQVDAEVVEAEGDAAPPDPDAPQEDSYDRP